MSAPRETPTVSCPICGCDPGWRIVCQFCSGTGEVTQEKADAHAASLEETWTSFENYSGKKKEEGEVL